MVFIAFCVATAACDKEPVAVNIERCVFSNPRTISREPAMIAWISSARLTMESSRAVSQKSVFAKRAFVTWASSARVTNCDFHAIGAWEVNSEAVRYVDETFTVKESKTDRDDYYYENCKWFNVLVSVEGSNSDGFNRYEGCASLTYDRCFMQNCGNKKRTWGSAIMSFIPGPVTLKETQFVDFMHQWSTTMVHVQCDNRTPANIFANPPVITRCIFRNIRTNSAGGRQEAGGNGLSIQYVNAMTLTSCIFENTMPPSGRNGGAMFCENHQSSGKQPCEYVFDNCTFRQAMTQTKGGCIWITDQCKSVELTNCTFDDCGFQTSSGLSGQIIAFGAGFQTLSIMNCTFTGMTAVAGMLETGAVTATITISGCTFSDITISANTFLITVPSQQNPASITETDFISCTSSDGMSESGLIKTETANVNIGRCQFLTCTGGGNRLVSISASDGTFKMPDCNFSSCSGIASCVWVQGTSSSSSGSLTLSGCQFDACSCTSSCLSCLTLSSVKVSLCHFTAPTLYEAGVASIGVTGDSCTVTVDGSCFESSGRDKLEISVNGAGSTLHIDGHCCFSSSRPIALLVGEGVTFELEVERIFECNACMVPPTPQFTQSFAMTESKDFTRSSVFVASDQFHPSEHFSSSDTMTASSTFRATKGFTQTMGFSQSDTMTPHSSFEQPATSPESPTQAQTSLPSVTDEHPEPPHGTSATEEHPEPPHATSATEEHPEPPHATSATEEHPEPPHATSATEEHPEPPHGTSATEEHPEPPHGTSATEEHPEPPHGTSATEEHPEPPHGTSAVSFPESQQTDSTHVIETKSQDKSASLPRTDVEGASSQKAHESIHESSARASNPVTGPVIDATTKHPATEGGMAQSESHESSKSAGDGDGDEDDSGGGGLSGGAIAGIVIAVIVVVVVVIVVVVVVLKRKQESIELSKNDESQHETAMESITDLDTTATIESALWTPDENAHGSSGQDDDDNDGEGFAANNFDADLFDESAAL